MTDIAEFFAVHARIARRALARFADVDEADLDKAAEGLGFGVLLRLDEAEEILDVLHDEDDQDGGEELSEDDDEEDG
jgi:hypothetical protein